MAKKAAAGDDDTAALKQALLAKRRQKDTREYLSTGSTLLNLAISDRVDGGFVKGGFHWLVGDSDSGKSFLSLTCLAEAAKNPAFDKYQFIHDNAENGVLMDIERFFGKRVAERLKPPSKHGPSDTIDRLYVNLVQAAERGPFIYVLDSYDALTSEQEQKKFKERIKAITKGVDAKGEMTDGKAKRNSSGLRQTLALLRDTNSIFTAISQTRDNMGYGFEDQTASGGRALKFYANVQLWTSPRGKLKKTVKGKERELGILTKIAVRKNRISGKKRDCIIPIYHSVGIDDIGSIIDWLIEEGHWHKPEGAASFQAPEFAHDGTKDKLIKTIEEASREGDLHNLLQQVWDEIETACMVKRKARYQ